MYVSPHEPHALWNALDTIITTCGRVQATSPRRDRPPRPLSGVSSRVSPAPSVVASVLSTPTSPRTGTAAQRGASPRSGRGGSVSASHHALSCPSTGSAASTVHSRLSPFSRTRIPESARRAALERLAHPTSELCDVRTGVQRHHEDVFQVMSVSTLPRFECNALVVMPWCGCACLW